MAIDLTDPPGSLYKKTRQLLRGEKRSLFEIAKESGIPFYWLRKVNAGTIHDPGVNRIQKLYEFLTNKPLELK